MVTKVFDIRLTYILKYVLFMLIAQCGRNNLVLEETFMMASKAAKVDSSSAEYLTEVGYQCLLQGRNKEATRYYKNATKLDESSVAALTGNRTLASTIS